jgi:UDP-glucose 4-epimerase
MLVHRHSIPQVPARTVVLGAKGFVALRLLARLASDGAPVLALPSAELDLTDAASAGRLAGIVRENDALVFVSALTPDRGKDIGTMMRNMQMGQHVCAALAERPCAQVVYLSTDAVYHDDANPVRESSCAQPSGYHGTMHVARERMLIETARASKTPLALLRPSLLYGAGDTHNGYGPNRFARAALTGDPIKLFGNGEEQRDHVDVADVAELTALVLAHCSAGVLNIATGTSTSFREVAKTIVGLVGTGVDVQPSARANPIAHRHFDVSAQLAAFPAFRPVALADGLTRMVQELQVDG